MKFHRKVIPFGVFLIAWASVELTLALTDLLPITQLATGANLVISVVAALGVTFALPALHQAVMQVPLQLLLGLQAIRFFGALFLAYSGQGLHPIWAVWAGWADIAVAAAALYAAWQWCPPNTTGRQTALWIWSLLGLVDILAAPASAITLRALYPETMTAILQWPLRIVPLFFVPLMIYLHVLIILRILKRTEESAPSVVQKTR